MGKIISHTHSRVMLGETFNVEECCVKIIRTSRTQLFWSFSKSQMQNSMVDFDKVYFMSVLVSTANYTYFNSVKLNWMEHRETWGRPGSWYQNQSWSVAQSGEDFVGCAWLFVGIAAQIRKNTTIDVLLQGIIIILWAQMLDFLHLCICYRESRHIIPLLMVVVKYKCQVFF